jgi:hypothetical protein
MISLETVRKYGLPILVATIIAVALHRMLAWYYPNVSPRHYTAIVIFIALGITAGLFGLWNLMRSRRGRANKVNSKNRSKKLHCTLLMLTVIILMTACQSYYLVAPPPPRYHTWSILTSQSAEQPGYAMYTYILFGRRTAMLDDETRERYQSLLDGIVSMMPPVIAPQGFPKEESNIFLIPYSDKPSMPLLLSKYNSDLAMNCIARLRTGMHRNPDIAIRFGSRPGPFLVSAYQPLGNKQASIAMLYADLSDTEPVAMREFIAAYKARIERKSVDEIERFKSFRLVLLGLIIDADRNLQIIQTAFAKSDSQH